MDKDSGHGGNVHVVVQQMLRENLVAVLFEPLHASKNLGLGLGLPLARALARLEGGDVRLVCNGPPQTTLALVLPLSGAQSG